MKLTELDPRWIDYEGRRVGLVLRCPHCLKVYLSCFFEPMPVLGGGQTPNQFSLFEKVLPEVDAHEVVPCKKTDRWTRTSDDFGTMSVTPSLDASNSGHWHGSITNGVAA